MADFPARTLTFLFTDIEASTALWERHSSAMARALARHDEILRRAVESHAGRVFKTVGDACCAVFDTASAAVAAALEAQRALQSEHWDEVGPLLVRVALHAGSAEERNGDFLGPPLNRVSRLLAAAHGGEILLSGIVQELLRDGLPAGVSLRDLGEHRLKDLERPEHVFQLVTEDLLSDFPPIRTLELYRHNLPVQRTPFIGRESDRAQVADMLRREDVRLVTLTGLGGTGKTRLALQVAGDLIEDFQDGVFIVDLAPISDAALVTSTMARVFGVRETGGRPLMELLVDHLRREEKLVVLDNFEQLLPATSLIAELLARCPKLKILVTSRSILNLETEAVFTVRPLEVAYLERATMSLEQLENNAAVRLFLLRARARMPEFTLTPETAKAVAGICVRVEGLPLAIELAAARIRLLSPEALLGRLEKRLELLTGGPGDLPIRQRTLRATLTWSYDLLEKDERTLFRRLSVFVGGCGLESARAVCYAQGDLQLDVLDAVGSLVDKSLLRAWPAMDDEPRFAMLETVREYALEELAGSGETENLRRGHAEHFMELAESAKSEYFTPREPEWLNRLEVEDDNLRAALSWALESGAAAVAARLATALLELWRVSGRLMEGRTWLERVVSERAFLPTEMQADVLNSAGVLAHVQGDYDRAQALFEDALALFRTTGNRRKVAVVLSNIGTIHCERGDYERPRELLEEALAIGRELGDRHILHDVLENTGILFFYQGDYPRALALFEESLALQRETGDRAREAITLNNIGETAKVLGDRLRARVLFEEGLELLRELDTREGKALLLLNLGHLAREEGDLARARALYSEALQTARDLGQRREAAIAIFGLAMTAAAAGQSDRASELYTIAGALREASSFGLSPYEEQTFQAGLTAARGSLGERFSRLWADAKAMPVEQISSFVLDEG